MHKLQVNDLSILLVEPSTAQRKIIKAKLAEAGINKVELADSIDTALAKLKEYVPDLVISSMYFPKGTGTDLILAIRSDDSLEGLAFMLISSETKFEHLDPIRQAGVVGILPKPFDAVDLRRVLESTLDYLEHDEIELENFDIRDVRVLMVDDSSMARKHIRRVLENLGATTITEAKDGGEAIALIRDHEFDIVVTDYNMPKVDGGQLLHYIRTQAGQSYLPVIMVTSESNQTTLNTIQQSGVSALCDKPFDAAHVKQLFKQLLSQD